MWACSIVVDASFRPCRVWDECACLCWHCYNSLLKCICCFPPDLQLRWSGRWSNETQGVLFQARPPVWSRCTFSPFIATTLNIAPSNFLLPVPVCHVKSIILCAEMVLWRWAGRQGHHGHVDAAGRVPAGHCGGQRSRGQAQSGALPEDRRPLPHWRVKCRIENVTAANTSVQRQSLQESLFLHQTRVSFSLAWWFNPE